MTYSVCNVMYVYCVCMYNSWSVTVSSAVEFDKRVQNNVCESLNLKHR